MQYFPLVFFAFFILFWLLVTSILGALSGWYSLMEHYPDRQENALLQLKNQYGFMGAGISMKNILSLSVCPSGLRVGLMRIFGIFCRDFFVPWQDIKVERKKFFFQRVAELQFGNPVSGKLSISAHVADRLAQASAGHWPETGPFPKETNSQLLEGLVKQWIFVTCLAAVLFMLLPRIVYPNAHFPPMAVAILFPAIVLGIACIFKYFNEKAP